MTTNCANTELNHYGVDFNGKRIILFAMISLFWLGDISALAQCGPDGEGDCTECGPHWGSWSGPSPSILTNGSVSPTAINQCGVNAPTMPTTIVAPVYGTPNTWHQFATYDCNSTVLTNTENITWSVSGVLWSNALPATVTNEFISTAYVNVTSSDPTNCPPPSGGIVTLATVTWSLPCPTITNCTVLPPKYTPADGYYGATIGYNFQCASGWYSWETNSVTDGCTTNFVLASATNAGSYNWSAGDDMFTPDPSGGSCVLTAEQTIYFAPVDGSGGANPPYVCSFSNTQTITITQTNAPNTPPHGTIIVNVTIGGGISTTNTY